MVIELELQGSKKVSLKRRIWDAGDPVFAQSQGSFQPLANGHILQNHGAVPKIEEFDESGGTVMRAWFGYGDTMETYRAYRYPWTGRPSTKPEVVACPSDDDNKTAIYVSWNGATDVESWKVYSGSQVKKTAVRNGFETVILVDGLSNGDSVSVEAIRGVGDGTRSASARVGENC